MRGSGSRVTGRKLAPVVLFPSPYCRRNLGLYSHLSRPPQGASDRRRPTRGGRRWPLQGARRTPAPRRPKPRVLARRRSGHEWWIETLSPPEDATEQATHTARGMPEISAFRGDDARVLFCFRTRGRGQAESPAFRAPLHIACLRCATRKGHDGPRDTTARPRRPNNRAGGALRKICRLSRRALHASTSG